MNSQKSVLSNLSIWKHKVNKQVKCPQVHTNFLGKVSKQVLSKAQVCEVGEVTDTSGKSGQLVVCQD